MGTLKAKDQINLAHCIAMLVLASILPMGQVMAQPGVSEKAGTVPTYTNPLGISIGDPGVLHVPGHYYIYGTGGGRGPTAYPTFTSSNLVDWVYVGETYSRKTNDSWCVGAFWAPEVYQVNGKFYMFYSAQWRENPKQELENFRIGVAVADQPTGPFKDIRNKPVFDPSYPIIDADVLFDTDGRVYLYYSRCCYKHPVESELADWARQKEWYTNIEESWIYGVELKPDFSGVIGEPVTLLRPPEKLSDPQSVWEDLSVKTHTVGRRWTEGPSSFKHGNTYYIMYAANSVAAGGDYATGYATSDKPLGPFKKAANNPLIFRNTASGGKVTTTGHTCWTMSPDGTQMYVLYGAVVGSNAGRRFPRRVLFLDRMQILSDGTLIAHSPTVTPQPYPSTNNKLSN
jgi:beta-xylosidase